LPPAAGYPVSILQGGPAARGRDLCKRKTCQQWQQIGHTASFFFGSIQPRFDDAPILQNQPEAGLGLPGRGKLRDFLDRSNMTTDATHQIEQVAVNLHFECAAYAHRKNMPESSPFWGIMPAPGDV